MRARWLCLLLTACGSTHGLADAGEREGDAGALDGSSERDAGARDASATPGDGATDGGVSDACRAQVWSDGVPAGWMEWREADDGRLLWVTGNDRDDGPTTARLDVLEWDAHGRPLRSETRLAPPGGTATVTRTRRWERLPDGRPRRLTTAPIDGPTEVTQWLYDTAHDLEIVHEVGGVETWRAAVDVDLEGRRATLVGTRGGERRETVAWNADGAILWTRLATASTPGGHCQRYDASYDADGHLVSEDKTVCTEGEPPSPLTWEHRWTRTDRSVVYAIDVLGPGATGALELVYEWSDEGWMRAAVSRHGAGPPDRYTEVTGCVPAPVRPRTAHTIPFPLEPYRLAGAPLLPASGFDRGPELSPYR